MRAVRVVVVALALLAVSVGGAFAERSCTRGDIADAVDAAGAALRKINGDTVPVIQSKMRQLRAAKGWSETDYQERAATLIQDERTEQLDAQSSDLLARIDAIGNERVEGAEACQRVDELDVVTAELSVLMRTKADYVLARLDALIESETRSASGPSGPALRGRVADGEEKPARPPVASAPPASSPRSASPPAAPPPKAAAPPPVVNAPPPKAAAPPPVVAVLPQGGWTTETSPQAPVATAPVAAEGDGYTIDEIQDATRGFFGQVSTGLASVIEHTFRRSGRPVGYVLGNEGGGAFLAGLRYGKGTLYLREGGTRQVYWHGPSIGYDFGLAGSKTMFLIYNLRSADDLFARFTGVDGSAYVVGGVGVTFLTNGQVVMAPIRSGIGLRIGANVGYVRFTPTATWNPF